MKTAVATRFCCSSPLTDLTQLTLMFLTLILQYINKLIEGEVGDLASPKSFHTRKVQGFNGDGVESLTKFRSKLPLKVFASVADFSIETCDLSHTPPPAIRTFNLSAEFFVERPKFVQVRFQRLWVLFFLTRAKCQVRVFHTEICPMHLPHIVKQIADTDTIRLIAKLILICFHGISHITLLTPEQWVGRHVTLRLRCSCLPV